MTSISSKFGRALRRAQVSKASRRLAGDPRAVFYGDASVEIDPEDASEAIGHQATPESVATEAIITDAPDDNRAAEILAAYEAMSPAEQASRTLLPPLACWNAMVIMNPMLGKVLAKALDYMLTKTLNDYPFEGMTIFGPAGVSIQDGQTFKDVVIDSASLGGADLVTTFMNRYVTLPFFRFTIAASTLNAASGSQIRIDLLGASNPQGATLDTSAEGLTFSIQRISNTEAVMGIYIPSKVVATRTLPFLPMAGDAGTGASAASLMVRFWGVQDTDIVSVTVPGYSTAELREIAQMYHLPSGLIR